ncbi:Sec-independent protein translocase protein TatB [Colwellia sp. KU-HH00111]|uniref:Sec-independent protein translocase protein TatB n=1 Tax=Colwellia sp. KU-HH00111 TaxID=3127652 RepID=UPI0031038ACB
MFDIGFWELMLIAVIGLVVLGPERLPVAIRTIRGWISGARKFSDTMKSELSEELRIHELHANLKKAEQGDMTNLSPEVAESVKSLQAAADMVNEPFKKVDTTALDTMISTSLANSSSHKMDSDDVKPEPVSNEVLTHQDESNPPLATQVPPVDNNK